MEPYKLRYLEVALADVTEIQEFNRRFSDSYQKKIIDALKARCKSLAENPYGAPPYEHDARYRRAVVDDYLIFYQVDDEQQTVFIYRILHGSRNIIGILKHHRPTSDE
ncbi:MAG: type II toxin-antitoxin system RelE/ParE family toxin [Coriobacteriales bacterium]|nr:type II toxin-antitoxin system RelE/ParE family toxin [Coriobacteriales bacterium]